VAGSFWEQINAAIGASIEGVHTCMPALVERYDSAKCQCDCTPLLKKNYAFYYDNGERKINDSNKGFALPKIINVPVVWPRTTDFIMHAPLVKRKDCVLLVFAERAMDEWLWGTSTQQATPVDRRQFALTDAIAIPGLFSFKQKSPVDSNDEAQIWYKDAVIRFEKGGAIDLNNGNFRVEQ
jgi:hypothetical protein